MSESTHWYLPDGKSCHDIDKREARKRGALPSVSGIIGQLDKPGLRMAGNNKISEYSQANPDSTNPIAEALKDWNDSAEWGSMFHLGINLYLLGEELPVGLNKEQTRAIWKWVEWASNNVKEVVWTERQFGTVFRDLQTNMKMGFGGTVDLVYRDYKDNLILADFKTKNGKKPITKENKLQLAAYGMKVWEEIGRPDKYMIFTVDRITGDVWPRHVLLKEEHTRCFMHLLRYWWEETMMSGDYNL